MSSWLEIIRTALATISGIGLGGFVIWTSLKDKASKYAFGGEVHAFLGNDETAMLRYRKVLELDPGHFDALYFMGARLAAEREFPQAVSCYERCLRQRPNNPNVLFKLGAVFYDMNHEWRAVALWKEFAERSGNPENVRMVKGLLERIAKGEKKILADEGFLKNFKWHEEGFGPSGKSALFLAACMVEFLLLASFLL
jgi:tetratricopeptide (TPR) repeat protein